MSKQNGDGIRRGIYFSPEVFKKADQVAAVEGLSRSQLVCKAIEYYANREKSA